MRRRRRSGKNSAWRISSKAACANPATRCGSRPGSPALRAVEELWSENFTRDLKDVFAVQSELAETIVAQVRGQLTGGAADSADKQKIQAEVQAAEKGGTKNVEAHQLYLQGRFYENRHSEKSAREALAAYQHATELDPGFALAWAGVAGTNVWLAAFATEGGQKTFDAHLSSARDAVTRALCH